MSGPFRSVGQGAERLPARAHLRRHRHLGAYAAIVLAGGYDEAGDLGRWRVSAGDVLIHGGMDAHQNHVGAAGTLLVNLPLMPDPPLRGAFRIRDADEIVRLARTDLPGALASLFSQAREEILPCRDWPDLLAERLGEADAPPIGAWAEQAGLAAESVTRGFARAYGVTPGRYRLELRARRAWAMIRAGEQGLAGIAQDCGFADQAHLTRTIARLTGRTPGRWRRAQVNSVQ